MLGYILTGSLLASGMHDPALRQESPIAEEDIDVSSFEIKSPPKKAKSSPLDDIEFLSEVDY
jgi:hypothetical protein